MFNTPDKNHIFFDCDDTLCMWDIWPMADIDTVAFEFHGRTYNLVPHKDHIQRLKDHHKNGHVVIVWSAGGSAWANCVVETLGLKEYVEAAIGKPTCYYDDLKVQEFMPEMNRVYIKPPVREERFCQTCGTIKVLVEKEPVTYRCTSCEKETL